MKCRVGVGLCLLAMESLFAENLGVLEDIMLPQIIKVDDGELFVVEDHTIAVFSLDDLTLKHRLGKAGQGPGEFNVDPSRTIVMSLHPDTIIAESRFKLICFDRQGTVLWEKKKIPGTIQTLPIGNGFVVLKITFEQDSHAFFTINLTDAEMTSVKELCRQPFFQYEDKTFVIPDALHFFVQDDLIYVDESPQGFNIGVYDANGNKVRTLHFDGELQPVTDADQQTAFQAYTDIPFFKRMIDQQGRAAFNRFIEEANLQYPDHFPAIRSLHHDGDRIYVRLHDAQPDQDSFIVLDTKGKTLGETGLPASREMPFLVKLQGDKHLFDIHQSTYYYLLPEDDDEEIWALHRISVKL